MASEILQKFLDEQLLNLGEENDKFEFLTKASMELSESLKKDRAPLVAATSVLLGGEMPATDSTYILCDAALKNAWPTYRGRFANNVDMLFRAALLQAISTVVADADTAPAAIVYYTATGLIPRLSTHAEGHIFTELYRSCAERVERDANLHWSPELSPEDFQEIIRALPVVDAETFAKQLVKAGTPAANAGDNPHALPTAPVEWINHFGKGVAEAIRTALQAAVSDQMSRIIGALERNVVQRAEAARLRANVLYWKSALYHGGTQQSFRDMKPDVAILQMAHDLHLQVPPVHPKSVEYFLHEAIRDAIGATHTDKKLSLLTYCKALAEEGLSVPGRPALKHKTRVAPGRAIWLAASRHMPPAEALALTSLPNSTTMSRAELAIEMFRDYQVSRLAEE